MEVVVTNENFESLKNGVQPFVVDFWAEWCGPCKMLSPIIAQLAEEYDGKVVVGKCNVEEAEDVAAEMGIRNIPTLIFFKNGQEVDRVVGAQSKTALQSKFDALA
jgi:thioredoxin 1